MKKIIIVLLIALTSNCVIAKEPEKELTFGEFEARKQAFMQTTGILKFHTPKNCIFVSAEGMNLTNKGSIKLSPDLLIKDISKEANPADMWVIGFKYHCGEFTKSWSTLEKDLSDLKKILDIKYKRKPDSELI